MMDIETSERLMRERLAEHMESIDHLMGGNAEVLKVMEGLYVCGWRDCYRDARQSIA